MKKEDLRANVVKYWIEKAEESLVSAKSEQEAKRYLFAVNRAYYACFYAASAILLKEGVSFKKHTGVRSAVHRNFVKTGRIDASWGRFYDKVFENRQRADYLELVQFDPEHVHEIIQLASGFISQMKQLLHV